MCPVLPSVTRCHACNISILNEGTLLPQKYLTSLKFVFKRTEFNLLGCLIYNVPHRYVIWTPPMFYRSNPRSEYWPQRLMQGMPLIFLTQKSASLSCRVIQDQTHS